MPMQFGFLFTLVLNFAGLLIAAYLFDGVFMAGYGWAMLAALVLTILHMVVRPILILLTLPFTIMTMGLFLLVINGLMFWLAGSVLGGYQVHGFVSALGGAVVVSVLGVIASWFSKPRTAGQAAQQRAEERQKVHIFTFQRRPGGPTGPAGYRPGAASAKQTQNRFNVDNRASGADDSIVDLEVDESGEWKIKE